jgi:hypothetical protein
MGWDDKAGWGAAVRAAAWPAVPSCPAISTTTPRRRRGVRTGFERVMTSATRAPSRPSRRST